MVGRVSEILASWAHPEFEDPASNRPKASSNQAINPMCLKPLDQGPVAKYSASRRQTHNSY